MNLPHTPEVPTLNFENGNSEVPTLIIHNHKPLNEELKVQNSLLPTQTFLVKQSI